EHLSALAEAAILVLASLFIAGRALWYLVGASEPSVDAAWYAFVVIVIVIAIDAGRAIVSARAARRYASAALGASALHFGSDLAGSIAVLVGLVLVRAGHTRADAAAALFVACLVLLAAGRLMRRNVDVLMDRAPADAEEAATAAIAGISPPVQLRRIRMRQAAGKQFADVVIGGSPEGAGGQGHAAADAVENAIHRALPESDVVVHVEPAVDDTAVRERVHAAAAAVPRVRELHNVATVWTEEGLEISLHLKLPGELSLADAHEVASDVERAIHEAVPEVASVQTHLEPLTEETAAHNAGDVESERDVILRIVGEATGARPRALRFLRTDDGLVAYLTLRLDPDRPLAEAHAGASEIEERIRSEQPGIADVVVHTEP